MSTHRCLYCKREIEVGRYGHLRPHKKGNQGCVGSGQSAYRMSKDEEFLNMMKRLKDPTKIARRPWSRNE